MGQTIHVIPTAGPPHADNLEVADCWCGAVGYVLCAECDGSDANGVPEGCWFCRGLDSDRPGLKLAAPGERPHLVIHNAPEGDDGSRAA